MTRAGERIGFVCRATRAAGGAVAALCVAAIAVCSAWGLPALEIGGGLFETLFEALFVSVVLMVAAAVGEAVYHRDHGGHREGGVEGEGGREENGEREEAAGRRDNTAARRHGGKFPGGMRRWGGIGIAAIAGLACCRIVLLDTLPILFRASVAKKFAYAGENDAAYARAVYEFDRWYVRGPFKEEILKTIPPGDALAWVSDLRGHVPSASLYPRRVYVLPELQRILNANAQTLWNERRDPLHPDDPRFGGGAAGYADEKVLDAFAAMIREKGIGWIVVYDSLRPEACRIVRVSSPGDGPEGSVE